MQYKRPVQGGGGVPDKNPFLQCPSYPTAGCQSVYKVALVLLFVRGEG